MTSAEDIAAASALVNHDTAKLLQDPEFSDTISSPNLPAAHDSLSVPLSSNADYFPTLESRDAPKNLPEDLNESTAQSVAETPDGGVNGSPIEESTETPEEEKSEIPAGETINTPIFNEQKKDQGF
jgi:hypothetical protein